MNIRQLHYFYTIASEGQITRAAKKLHMAQPPLSQALKALEINLGVLLFERHGRKMELTEAGKVLFERATHIFQTIDDTKTEIKEIGRGVSGSLAIGCVKSCFSYLIRNIRLFRTAYPKTTFKLTEGDSFQLTKQLENRDIELAIVRLPLEIDDYASYKIATEKYVAVLPENWAKKWHEAAISIQELADMPLLLLHRTSGRGQYEVILEAFHKRKLEPNILCESPNVDMILGLVNEEIGVTIIPKSSLLTFHHSGLTILPILDTTIESESMIIWLRDRYLSKSAVQFIEMFEIKHK
ncbi:MAG TPA: LysR family transcriptional regulator [Bacillota bacterium]|nr:LysR family transcriptional regulator [Bacillota bacterium]